MIGRLGLNLPDDQSGIAYWRKNVLRAMTLTLVIVGAIVYVPGVWLSIVTGVYGLVVAVTLAYGLLLLIHFSKRISHGAKVAIFLVVIFLFAFYVFLETGKEGTGLLWLFTVAPLAGLLLGFRSSLVALVLEALTLSLLGWLISARLPAFPALL